MLKVFVFFVFPVLLRFFKEIRSFLVKNEKNIVSFFKNRYPVITLLEKKCKSCLFIKNWRPISLLNVDYKILTKCFAERMKKVLLHIIHHNQTGFGKGRNITDGIGTMLEIVVDTDVNKISGMIMNLH